MPTLTRSSPSRRPPSSSNPVANDESSGLTISLDRLSLDDQLPPAKGPSSARSPPPPPIALPSSEPPPHVSRQFSKKSPRPVNGAASARSPTSRRSFSQASSPTTNIRLLQLGSSSQEEEELPPTPESVAYAYFRSELELHHGAASTLPTEAIVILNDAVYGHRFSRPRTSRSALGTIVERPERIKAVLLGLSAAYVRLGGRHFGGSFPIRIDSDAGAATSIPFRILKTTRSLPLEAPAVVNVHGAKWMQELKLMCKSAEYKLAMGEKELQRPELSRAPDQDPPQKLHEGDLYLCSESLQAMEGALGAVCEAVDAVFNSPHRRAFVGVRPPGHHCSASHPSGFCWVNNVHVGIMHAVLTHGLTHAAIIDFDLHHGDGSQSIAWQHNARAASAARNASPWKRTSIGYFSLHDINSYPCEMGDEEKVKNASLCIENAHGQSIWNVHLQPWKTEADFWLLYQSNYTVLLDKTRAYLASQAARLKALNQTPKAAIFFSAGFDASEWEGAGMQRHQVNVPTEFYARLTQDVVKLAAEDGLYAGGRLISVLEGGYSDRALFSGVLSHLSGLVGHQPAHAPVPQSGTHSMLDAKMGADLSRTDGGFGQGDRPLASLHPYDPSWWANPELDRLETLAESLSPSRRQLTCTPPSYSTPTQASTAKAIDRGAARRSLSGASTGTAKDVHCPPSPPPSEISWVIAAHALSKLLIPSGRQTDSCRPEDLNAEATRIRRDRQSSLMSLPSPSDILAQPGSSKMALRERKVKAVVDSIDEEVIDELPKGRRKTVAVGAASPDKHAARIMASSRSGVPPSSRRISRRLSGIPPVLVPAKEEPTQAEAESDGLYLYGKLSSGAEPEKICPVDGSDKKSAKMNRTTPTITAPKASRSPRKTSPGSRHGKAAGRSVDRSAPAATSSGGASDDITTAMDGITAGVKKIRINLITKTQREAIEKAQEESRKAAAAADACDVAATDPAQGLPGESQMEIDLCDAPAVHGGEKASAEGPLEKPHALQQTIPPGVKQTARQVNSADTMDVQGQVVSSSSGGDVFVPYHPMGPAPVAAGQQEPLKWLPPNVLASSAKGSQAGPAPIKNEDKLFRYASGIPFAPTTQDSSSIPPLGGSSCAAQQETPLRELESGASPWETPDPSGNKK